MPRLQQVFQPEVQPEDAHVDARRTLLGVQHVQQDLCQLQRAEAARNHPLRRAAAAADGASEGADVRGI